MKRLQNQNTKLQLKTRRRRGGTSPPLVCIESNPGPKTRAKRKSKKEHRLETPKKRKRDSQTPLSPKEREELKRELLSGRSAESIIKKGKFSKKVVGRWSKRLKQTGDVKRAPAPNNLQQEENDENDENDESDESDSDERKIVKHTHLSEFEKGEIFAMYSHNYSTTEIANFIGRGWSTVRMWIKRWEEEHNFETKPRSGRPRVTLPGEDRLVKIVSLQDPNLTAVSIAAIIRDNDDNPKASAVTIRRRLISFGIYARRRRKKPLLSPANIKARLAWAKAHQDWTVEQWRKVLWSDESPFMLFPGSRGYVRRRACDDMKKKHLAPTVKHGGGSVMVWGCFHGSGVGVLKRVEGTIDSEAYRQILIHQAMPELKKLISQEPTHVRWIFQQDNAKPHTAKIVKQYLDTKQREWGGRLEIMEWPSQSPDLNPIENAWSFIKRKLRHREKKPSSHQDLYQQIFEIWREFPSRILINLIESMPRRVQMVIRARGGSTKY